MNRVNQGRGLILSRHSFDLGKFSADSFVRGKSEDGTRIVLWVKTDSGTVKLNFDKEKPVLFVKTRMLKGTIVLLEDNGITVTYRNLALKSFKQRSISSIYFERIEHFYRAKALLTEESIKHYESNIRLEERFLMERFIYGSIEFEGNEYQREGYKEYFNPSVRPCDSKVSLSTISIDIECSEKGELFSIGFYGKAKSSVYEKVVMIDPDSNGHGYSIHSDGEGEATFIEWVRNEAELLVRFDEIINELDPDVVIGWNVVNFDFRVLNDRAEKLGIALKVGRATTKLKWRASSQEHNTGFLTIEGRIVIDGIAALKAEAYQFPSFSLEAMANHFLGKGKDTEDPDNRLATILHDFKFNKVKLAKYNLEDCRLVWKIFQKAKLIEFLVFRAHLTGLELDRAGGSVAAFCNLYLPRLHRTGYISPNLPESGGLTSPGGYVMDSKPGLYRNVLVLDFKSLYPSIIRTFKIDPLGLAEGLKEAESPTADLIPGFKGAWFSRDKHILPNIITNLWQQRDIAKAEKDSAKSQAIKILMNSFYGVLGSGGCPFYDPRLASSITMRGHWIMKQTAQWIEDKGLTVIYGDTDSTFVLVDESLTNSEAKEIGIDIQDYINAQWALKLKTEFDLDCFLELEFETHFSKFLMPTIRGSEQGSKKRYAGLIEEVAISPDSSQRIKSKLIFKGLENVRTDWTVIAKGFQETLYGLIFSDKDPAEFIQKTVRDIYEGKVDDQLFYRKRIRKPLAGYTKNVPPHVKAARLADEFLIKNNRAPRYKYRGTIEYVLTLNGPQPRENICSPFDYQHYIDKQIQPVADAILPFINTSFEEITSKQLGLF